ncbi:MAG: endonuclease MutS2 [Microscillaceae bacterium]|nr:endonuclease MutS2 [Microscillaceae bacterium]MDW8460312.1 endonuclease MutS2 [Cytophagales bacterium]
MLYPHNLEQKLGFDKIRELLKQLCVSPLGIAFVEKIKFSTNFEYIQKLTQQTYEFKQILLLGEQFPEQNYLDVSAALQTAQIEGSCLSEKTFFDLLLSLKTITECLQFFTKKRTEEYPLLSELAQNIIVEKQIIPQIQSVIDEHGRVRDTASPELAKIRKAIVEQQQHLRKKLDSLLRTAKQEGLTKEDASLTIREGRMVIPLAAEAKRKMKGFIHDESATGQTVYLEPTEVFELNNEIRNLQYREQWEVVRILTDLTAFIRPYLPNLQKAYHFLGMMDFIRAKARLALKIEAHQPLFVKKSMLKWFNAKHPLLYLNHQAQGKPTIPLNIELSENQRILIISGPNAGGKSVALKTVGLLQYMYQCGLLIPVSPDSTVGIFQAIFVDIGDEQSIENDLSTYSSHLKNMKYFLQFANAKTLFLIDEFGTGTEPAMGGAMAEAILEQLYQQKAMGIITTHYTNLKHFANSKPEIANAAMRYDVQNLEPLYQLEIGKPGSSFAFEIAKKMGISEQIIQKARQKVGTKQADFDQLLAQVEAEKKYFQEQNAFLQKKEKILTQTIEQYEKLKNLLETERKKILNQAKQEAKQLVQEANRKIEHTIRQIREQQAEKETTKQLRAELAEFARTELQPEEISPEATLFNQNPEAELINVLEGKIEVGDIVRIKGQSAMAEVVNIRNDEAEILMGELKSFVKISRLEKLNCKQIRQQTQNLKSSYAFDMSEKTANFTAQLDVRGMRAEQAIQETENFIDTAIYLGRQELRIIHGKGDGILRTAIRQHLKKYKQIKQIEDDHADRGGAGVSVLTLA